MLLFLCAFLKCSSFYILQKYELKSSIFLTGLPDLGVGISSKVLFFKIGIRNFRILNFLILSPPLVQAMCHSKKKEWETNSGERRNEEKKYYENNTLLLREGKESSACL